MRVIDFFDRSAGLFPARPCVSDADGNLTFWDDEQGQPLASTLADYMLPGAPEVPHLRIEHFETPSPHTEFGAKGMGEGGAIAPPAVIFNAVNDALRPLGAEVARTPLSPRRLLQAIHQAQAAAQKAA